MVITLPYAKGSAIVAVNSAAGSLVRGLHSTSVELPDDTARALFERSGVIRVDTVGDLFDIALLLTTQPLPSGSRVMYLDPAGALPGMLELIEHTPAQEARYAEIHRTAIDWDGSDPVRREN